MINRNIHHMPIDPIMTPAKTREHVQINAVDGAKPTIVKSVRARPQPECLLTKTLAMPPALPRRKTQQRSRALQVAGKVQSLTVSPDDSSKERLFALQAKYARATTSPESLAAATVRRYLQVTEGHDELERFHLIGLTKELLEQSARTHAGDMARPEAMLTAQAHTLDAVFNHLATRAAENMGEYLDATDTYLRLALKAQSQCRATLETLAAIKNPPVVFAKQANIAHGPQQVNYERGSIPRVEQIKSQPIELLEHEHAERLESSTTRAASGRDRALETMVSIYRPAIEQRKGSR